MGDTDVARILVADDEELARYTIREILEGMGHTVLEARTGNGAMKVVRTNPVDLVITDIIMPREDGVTVTAEVKRTHPEVKVIAISGGGRTNNIDFLTLAKGYGADDALAKPFTEDELRRAVDACLAGR